MVTKGKDIRKINTQKVRDCFRDHEVCTKNQIAEITDLSLASVTNILKYLLEKNEIIQIEDSNSTGGRRAKRYQMNKEHKLVMSMIVEYGSDMHTIYYQICNIQGEIILKDIHQQSIINIKVFEKIIGEMLEIKPNIKAIGISVPGVVSNGKLIQSDLLDLNDIDIEKILKDKFNVKVILENDVNLAVIGFADGLENKTNHLAFLFQPENHCPGCGIMINQKVCKGMSYFSGEMKFLPTKSLDEKARLVQTTEGTLLLVAEMIAALCVVINPEVVGICAPRIEDIDMLNKAIEVYIPKAHVPEIKQVKDINQMIEKGLIRLSYDALRYQYDLINTTLIEK